MNIYKRKARSRNILGVLLIVGVTIFMVLCPTLFCLSSFDVISSAVALGCNITMIIILACIGVEMGILDKEMDDIENTLVGHFRKDLKEEMLETFNDRELNKILEISRQRDKEKEEQEKKELQEIIKDIKEKFHL